MTEHVYTCALCGGRFRTERPTLEAEAEAAALWGIAHASTDPRMAEICDECFELLAAIELEDKGTV